MKEHKLPLQQPLCESLKTPALRHCGTFSQVFGGHPFRAQDNRMNHDRSWICTRIVPLKSLKSYFFTRIPCALKKYCENELAKERKRKRERERERERAREQKRRKAGRNQESGEGRKERNDMIRKFLKLYSTSLGCRRFLVYVCVYIYTWSYMYICIDIYT